MLFFALWDIKFQWIIGLKSWFLVKWYMHEGSDRTGEHDILISVKFYRPVWYNVSQGDRLRAVLGDPMWAKIWRPPPAGATISRTSLEQVPLRFPSPLPPLSFLPLFLPFPSFPSFQSRPPFFPPFPIFFPLPFPSLSLPYPSFKNGGITPEKFWKSKCSYVRFGALSAPKNPS